MEYRFSGILVRYIKSADSSKAHEHQVAPQRHDDLHVNLWELGQRPFLDIGIKIHTPEDIEAVQIDTPWEVHQRDVSDLGALLNSEKAVAAIFNEVVEYKGQADQAYAEVSFKSATGHSADEAEAAGFYLLRINPTLFDVRSFTLTDESIASRIVVRIPDELKKSSKAIYLRFRIRNVPQEVYCSEFDQRDRNLLSSSTETRIIDFRINVRRAVPDEVLASIPNVYFPSFRKIHFFLTVARTEICEFQNKDFVGCRSLVDEREWNQYANSNGDGQISAQNCSVRDYLGYHWCAKASGTTSVKDLGILGRFTRHRSNVFQILRFVLLGLIFGMIGNGLWDVLKPSTSNTFIDRLNSNLPSLELIGAATMLAIGLMVQFAFYKRLFQYLLRFPKYVFKGQR